MLRSQEVLASGWSVEHSSPNGSIRFSRARAFDRRRAISRLVVMGGCFAVAAALFGASSDHFIWLITWSIIVLFAITGVLAGLAAAKDFRRANVGVYLEVDVTQGRVRGIADSTGLVTQLRVETVEFPLREMTLTLSAFEERDSAGTLICLHHSGVRLLAPDFPRLEPAKEWLAAAQCS